MILRRYFAYLRNMLNSPSCICYRVKNGRVLVEIRAVEIVKSHTLRPLLHVETGGGREYWA